MPSVREEEREVAMTEQGHALTGAAEDQTLASSGGQAETEEERREAAAEHQRAVNSAHLRELGNAAYRRKRFDSARDLYTKAIRHKPTCKVLCNRSIANLKLERYGEALRDARLASLADSASAKAHVRAAVALDRMMRLPEAECELLAALDLEPASGEISQQLDQVRQRMQMLERAKAVTDKLARMGDTEDLAKLKEVQQIVAALEMSAAAPGGAMDAATFRKSLGDLTDLLPSRECLDYFMASKGLTSVMAHFNLDNTGALKVVYQVLRASPQLSTCLPERDMHTIVSAIQGRRVALISLSLDIQQLLTVHKGSVSPAANVILEPGPFKALLSILATGPLSLQCKATRIVEQVAHRKLFALRAMESHSDLHKGLVRCCHGEDNSLKALTLSIILKLEGSRGVLTMLSSGEMALGMASILREALSSVPMAAPTQGTSGLPVFEPHSLSSDQLAQLADILRAMSCLALTKAFVEKLEPSWALVVPVVLRASKAQQAGMELLACAARRVPEIAVMTLQEPKLLDTMFELTRGGGGQKASEWAAYILNIVCETKEFQRQVSLLRGVTDLAELLEPSRPDLCAILACRILYGLAREDVSLRDKLCADAHLLESLVRAWYGRRQPAKGFVLRNLKLLLSEEEGARTLTETVSEGQALSLIDALAQEKALVEAWETGGSSLFAPSAGAEFIIPHKADLLRGIDCDRVAQYVNTLLPARGAEEHDRIVVDVCAASCEDLCLAVASTCSACAVYCVEWERGLVDQLQRLLPRDRRENVFPLLCDLETLRQLPTQADAVLLAGMWKSVEDPPQLFSSIKSKLKSGGKVVIIEEKESEGKDAYFWASKTGFAVFAEPKHVEGCFICAAHIEAGQ